MRARDSHLWRRIPRDDRGVGLILVIGLGLVVFGLVMVAGTMVDRSLRSSHDHVRFEQALGVAEYGINQGLARAVASYDTDGSDYLSPRPAGTTADPSPDCVSAVKTFPTLTGAQSTWEAQERTWARTTMNTLAGTSGCLRRSPDGDYVLLKPQGRQTVYAMSWVPSRGAAGAKSRVVKAEYIFAPYKPSHAILTSGSLELDSSTKVVAAGGADPTVASVHSNGNVTVGGGNPTVTGAVTQTGSGALASSNKFSANPGGAVRQTGAQSIPKISAQQVYARNALDPRYSWQWYDLCTDGKVRRPVSTTPCAGTLVGDYGTGGALSGQSFRGGWTYDPSTSPATWRAGKNVQSGAYYVVGNVAPATGAGNTSIANATIIAQATTTTCNKVGGNLDWDHNDIDAPVVDNLFMLADQDLRTSSNFSAGSSSGGTVISGMFIAGDQVEMQTSSNGAYGSVVTSDQCDPPDGTSMVDANVIKNPSIYYDPNGYAPFTDIINTTLWLEFVG